jgi:thiamine biosynthesis lipoprotein
MGTTYSVIVPKPPQGVDRDALQRTVDGVLDQVNRHLSTYEASSEITAINRSASTQWIEASAPLIGVLRASAEIRERSAGAFDITVATPRQENGPIGISLRDSPPALRKSRPDVRLDVDGIAPGYAVDEIARQVRALGVKDVLVEIGGEVAASGRSPSGRPWRIAIEEPLPGERRAYAVVELDGKSISTSGDYRDFRLVDGHRVSGTIDPRSGLPAPAGLESVSVIHDSTMYADGYATAFMVLGPEEGPRLARSLGLAVLFLVRDPGSGVLREISTPEFAQFRRPLL